MLYDGLPALHVDPAVGRRARDGTGSPDHGVTGSAILAGSRVNVSDPVFDLVLSFNMRVYRGVVSTE